MQTASTQTSFTTSSHPFLGHIDYFKAIPHHKRGEYRKQVLSVKPSTEPPSVIYEKSFPQSKGFTYEGYRLNYYSIEQTSEPSAICVFMHGLNDHGGIAGYFGHRLTEANPGVNFFSLDQMNFGQSEGDFRGYFPGIEKAAKQGEALIEHVLRQYESRPSVFLVGMSLGGAITFQMGVNHPENYKGVIFLAPAFGSNREDIYHLKLIMKTVGIFVPKLFVPMTAIEGKTTKYNLSKHFEQDLNYFSGGYVSGTVRNTLHATDLVRSQFSKFSLPYITIMGGIEKVVDMFAPLDFDEVNSSPDKTTIYCRDMWHSVFFEEEVVAVSEIVASWLQQRI